MAKLNKELQENLKEINSIIFKMAEVDNDVVLTTSIHSEMIVVSINFIKNGIVELGESYYLLECNDAEERTETISKIKKILGL